MKYIIEHLPERKLVGKRLKMTFADNKTGELWKSFMPRCNEIQNAVGTTRYSLQNYKPGFFDLVNPLAVFEKWATVEVTDFNDVPPEMETFVLPEGLYAVFHYKGSSASAEQVFHYIFGTWLPASDYLLDDRPHFEILGEKYKNCDPDSEEDICIPIKPKN
ncbi:MAG: GyrI-like domain-containing protein [Bacteroidetes bacterium HGW-Bacteroidetes-21]|jgi:AraC family transcriptional regulator|nr:MAG: GyrI-like domain-containing protein [Bacteroidetes bacterium HGW-Bacteroidetes-21]